MDIFDVESYINLAIGAVLLALAIFALVNCLTFSSDSYEAADKMSKLAWSVLLAVSVLVQLVLLDGGFRGGLVQIIVIIPSLVYLTDVRPALSGLYRRR